jgi:hypothetical protein
MLWRRGSSQKFGLGSRGSARKRDGRAWDQLDLRRAKRNLKNFGGPQRWCRRKQSQSSKVSNVLLRDSNRQMLMDSQSGRSGP